MWWNDYVGLPYKFRGRDRDGIDCYGLVELVHKEVFGNDLEFVTSEDVPIDQLSTGDIIRMNGFFGNRLTSQHCGVVTEPGWLLHTDSRTGSIHQPLKGGITNRIKGAYRVVG